MMSSPSTKVASHPPPSPPSSTPNPARQPLPLSASQEQQVRDLYYKRVRTKCADEVRDFAACCTHRTFTATLFCRTQQKAMNKCMMQYATPEEMDAAREEWFAGTEKRREERERKEEKRKVDEAFWREWWAKDREGEGKKG